MESLTSHLQDENDHNNVLTISKSPYYCLEDITKYLHDNKTKLTILSLNIQSLNAKFDKFISILQHLHLEQQSFDIICLQETWLADNSPIDNFTIPNYTLLHQGFNPLCSRHGGLIFYIKDGIPFKILKHCNNQVSWEAFFSSKSIKTQKILLYWEMCIDLLVGTSMTLLMKSFLYLNLSIHYPKTQFYLVILT